MLSCVDADSPDPRSNLREALGGQEPRPISELMGVYLAYLVQVEYFPPPPLAGRPGILKLPKVSLSSHQQLHRSSAQA